MSETLKSYLMVFFTSMLPIIELRGGVPAGIALGLSPWAVMAVSVAGNVLPVPFILLFIEKILIWMEKVGGFLGKVAAFLRRKAEKSSDKVRKYELLGLFLLVAIPLPGTGAWTGSLVAALLELPKRKAWPVIVAGVVASGIVMLIVSLGLDGLFHIG